MFSRAELDKGVTSAQIDEQRRILEGWKKDAKSKRNERYRKKKALSALGHAAPVVRSSKHRTKN